MKQFNFYCKHYKFNRFIVSQYCRKYNTNKMNTMSLFFKNRGFEYIDQHYRIIVSLPLDDIIDSLYMNNTHSRDMQ